jgi:branched-chain amino acid transport system ATP-binding protein
LRLDELSRKFGSLVAVNNVSMSVDGGEVLSIIGPNGAGKTTLFNLITGELTPTSGQIYYKGSDIMGFEPHQVVETGIARSFQVTNVFPELTVAENLRVGAQRRHEWYNFWRPRSAFPETGERVQETLELMQLEDYADTTASELSHADQRLLEVGLAVMMEPELLMLDEPTAGMSSEETKELFEVLNERVFPRVEAVMMIEHNMNIIMDHSDRIVVLHSGAVIQDGTATEIQNDKEVQRVYLGEGS